MQVQNNSADSQQGGGGNTDVVDMSRPRIKNISGEYSTANPGKISQIREKRQRNTNKLFGDSQEW